MPLVVVSLQCQLAVLTRSNLMLVDWVLWGLVVGLVCYLLAAGLDRLPDGVACLGRGLPVRLWRRPLGSLPWQGLGFLDGNEGEKDISPPVRGGGCCGLGRVPWSPGASRLSSAFFGALTRLGEARLASTLLGLRRRLSETFGDLRGFSVAPAGLQLPSLICGTAYLFWLCEAFVFLQLPGPEASETFGDFLVSLGILQFLLATSCPFCHHCGYCAFFYNYCWTPENLGDSVSFVGMHNALKNLVPSGAL